MQPARSNVHRVAVATAASLALLASVGPACTDVGGSADSPDGSVDANADAAPDVDPNASPDITDLVLIENPGNVLSFFATWQTAVPATTRLDITCGEEIEQTLQSASPVLLHEVFVMGLLAGARCDVTVTSEAAAGVTDLQTVEYLVGDLPADLPEMTVETFEAGTPQPGWTLVPLINAADRLPLHAAAFDERGRYRWIYERPDSQSGSDNPVRVVDDGILIGGESGIRPPMIVSWDGTLVWEGDFLTHHDLIQWPDRDTVVALQRRQGFGCTDEDKGQRITIYERATNAVTWQWVWCDHYHPPSLFNDWIHANSVEAFPGEEAILVSSRNLHALFKIDIETQDIVWMMGYGGQVEDGWRSDFDMAEEDRFLHQHSAKLLPNGNILLFDNGREGDREWSRALEIAYDEQTMTAEAVWEYRPSPDEFTIIWGDADLEANGDRLVTFGRRDGTFLVEVNENAEPVWRMTYPPRWGSYRAERIEPPSGWVVEADEP